MNSKKTPIQFTLNGEHQTLEIPSGLSALELLRDILKLKGTKEGCGIGECGACTIVVDGKAINACLLLAAQLEGRDVLTVEGLGDSGRMHPIQQAFLDNHGVLKIWIAVWLPIGQWTDTLRMLWAPTTERSGKARSSLFRESASGRPSS